MSSVETFHREIATLLRRRPNEPGHGPLAPNAIYTTLVFRQKESLVASLCAAVKLAAEAMGHDFAQLVHDFATKHPPVSWDPNAFVAPFGAYLAQRRAHDGDQAFPAYLEELADLSYLRYRVMLEDFDDGTGLDQTLFVRRYQHDVLGFIRRVERKQAGPSAPTAGAQTVVVCRSRVDQRRREFVATAADLSAIAVRLGMDPTASVSDSQLAEVELVREGVLA